MNSSCDSLSNEIFKINFDYKQKRYSNKQQTKSHYYESDGKDYFITSMLFSGRQSHHL